MELLQSTTSLLAAIIIIITIIIIIITNYHYQLSWKYKNNRSMLTSNQQQNYEGTKMQKINKKIEESLKIVIK